MKKEKNSVVIIPIAMMFFVIGITTEIRWLKYTLWIISMILCILSIGISIKDKKE